jgi:hypothetical protein
MEPAGPARPLGPGGPGGPAIVGELVVDVSVSVILLGILLSLSRRLSGGISLFSTRDEVSLVFQAIMTAAERLFG